MNSTLDFKSILNLIVHKWYYFAVSFAVFFTVSYLYLRYSQPIYSVKTTILIKDEKNKGTGAEDLLRTMELFDPIRNTQNEIEILRSHQMVNKTIKALDFEISYFIKGSIKEEELYKKFPLNIRLDTSAKQVPGIPYYIKVLSDSTFSIYLKGNDENTHSLAKDSKTATTFEIQGKLGEPVKTYFFNLTVEKSPNFSMDLKDGDELYFIINDLNKLTETYVSKLDIQLINKNSSILLMQISGPVIEKEIDFLNKLGEVYIQTGLDEKNQIAINTINFIDEQLFEITDSLRGAENQLESFRKSEGVMSLSNTAENAFNLLEKLEEEKAVLVVRDKYYKYLLNYVSNNYEINKLVAPSTMGIDDPLLNKLVSELYTLNSEQAALKFSAKEKNPTFHILDLKVESTKKALIENVTNIIQSSKISLTDINERLNKVKGTISKLPNTERNLVQIQRKFNLNDHIYNYLLEKRAEAGLAKAANTPNHTIIDKAMLFGKNPVFPDRKRVYIITFLLSLLSPGLILFLKNYFNDTITSKETIEKTSSVPIIGMVGHYTGDSTIPIIDSPKSQMSESLRSLRVNLQYIGLNKKNKIIGITSSISGEGKTFFALNLAASIAIVGAKVVLLGADLRRPKLNSNLQISNEIGISTYLINKSKLDEIIKPTTIENLDFIPSGPVPPNPTELLESSQTQELINILSDKYDFIIVDAPPIGLVADYYLLSKFIDANLYLVRQHYTSLHLLSELNDIYKKKKLNNLYIVFNDVKNDRSKYGYGYEYGYGYGYYEENNGRKKWSNLFSFLKK